MKKSYFFGLATKPNMTLNLAPFGRWTLRDKAAQRRLALRWASRQIWSLSLSARVFAELIRLLSATAESVCVTSLPALLSSPHRCA